MSTTTKSPFKVARAALLVATKTLPTYAHQFSPKKFTLPQLLTILVLRKFFKTDYRGITILLQELPQLANTIGLKSVPHYTAIQKASKRILTYSGAVELLYTTVKYALAAGRLRTLIKIPTDSVCKSKRLFLCSNAISATRFWDAAKNHATAKCC